MKFKEIKKRKVYKTWQNKNRRTGLILYIYYTPQIRVHYGNFFHFSVSHNKKMQYNSLDHKLTFDTFDDCKLAIEDWFKNYK